MSNYGEWYKSVKTQTTPQTISERTTQEIKYYLQIKFDIRHPSPYPQQPSRCDGKLFLDTILQVADQP